MPETESSSNTAVMNANLRSKLREAASQLRDLRTQGAPMEAARAAKEQALEVIFRMLCIHLGTPPSRFVWQWEDRDRAFHRHGEVTPQEFANFIIEPSLGESVCLVHDPRPEHPYGRTYTVEHLGNVVGGERVIYLNVELPVMKNAIRSTLEAAQPVWFGCDVAPMMARDLGIWDASTFDWNRLYGTQFTMDKATRVRLGESRMTHAMVFTGADISGEGDADRTGPVVRRWRVENSWGTEAGQKGFFTMNDSWFDEYVFEAAVHRRFIPQSLLAALDAEPIVLPPWDPMGALAHR